IIKKRLNLQESLYTILQVLSISLFERASMFQLLTFYDYINDTDNNLNQLNLFTDYSGQ
ncbi:MAG: IS4 family transposase, partial [Smithellaceae bacterium]|nr:IS4 family transposase [Smithellaceae bacterium]